MFTYVYDLIFNVFDGVFNQNLNGLPASIRHQAAVQVLDLPQDVRNLELVDKRTNGLKHELDVVDGMALLDREDHVRGFNLKKNMIILNYFGHFTNETLSDE